MNLIIIDRKKSASVNEINDSNTLNLLVNMCILPDVNSRAWVLEHTCQSFDLVTNLINMIG